MQKNLFSHYFISCLLFTGFISPVVLAAPPTPVVKAPSNISVPLTNANALDGKIINEIHILGIDDDEQINNARVFLGLTKIKGEKITQPDYVHYLIENGRGEINRSQQPFGFYHAQTTVRVDVQGENITVTYQVEQNQPTHLAQINVQVQGTGQTDPEFQKLLRENPLKIGDVLHHNTYETYKAKFLALATARGYFDGQFTAHRIEVDPKTQQAKVNLVFVTGDRYRFENVSFNKTPLQEDLLQRFVQFKPGQPYLSSDVAMLQQDLQGSGYFQQVLVGGEPDKASKTIPINAQLTMDENRRYAFGLGYSTDTGYRGKVEFDRRWLNSRGHQLSTKLFASQKNSSLDALYRIPAKNPTTDYYYLRVGGHIKGDEYDSKRGFIEGGYNFRRGMWEHRYGAVASWEKFTIGLDHGSGWLLYPRGQWTYTSTANRLNPTDGYQVRLEVKGASEHLLSDTSFLQGNFDTRYLHSINEQNRILGRLSLGATWTDDFHSLPPSLRYFAGGDRSIRGYAFESLGGHDNAGNNIGGRYLAVGSLEYEYYFRPNWAVAAFVDAGDAFIKNYHTYVGAGLGMHWRSPVGPIKVDVGHGFNKEYGDDFRLHISIGAELDL